MKNSKKFRNLLSVSSDFKTKKGEKLGFLTGILYLMPTKKLCPFASIAGCSEACLVSAGRGAFNSVKNARINKGELFENDQEYFMLSLIHDIKALERKAKREKLTPLVRLNGTSDINYLKIKINGKTIFEHFPHIQFYDYTKNCLTAIKNTYSNYDITFSYSALPAYDKYVKIAIKSGVRMAVVFRDKNKIPSTFLGLNVVNGDNSDVRHLDNQGVIVALYAKGKAKKDDSGFVVDGVMA